MKLTLKRMLIMFALIPLTVSIIVVSLISSMLTGHNLSENTLEELKVAANGLKLYYEDDIINNSDTEDNFVEYNPSEYIDEVFSNTGIYLTLFKDNVRFMTSLRNNDGSRNEGTTAADDIYNSVKNGNDYSSEDVIINGTDYYVYYTPLYDKNQTVIGMAFAGKPSNNVDSAKKIIINYVIAIGILLEIIFVIATIIISKKVSNPIVEASEKLEELSDGNTNLVIKNKSYIAETKSLLTSIEHLSKSLTNIVNTINQNLNVLNTKITETTDNSLMKWNKFRWLCQM